VRLYKEVIYIFWERFYSLCIKKETKPNPVAKELGISSGVLTKWKSGTIPSGETLTKIADYFGVSVDYLLGNDNVKVYDDNDNIVVIDNETRDIIDSLRTRPEMKILFSVSKKATKQDIEKTVAIIEALRDTEK